MEIQKIKGQPKITLWQTETFLVFFAHSIGTFFLWLSVILIYSLKTGSSIEDVMDQSKNIFLAGILLWVLRCILTKIYVVTRMVRFHQSKILALVRIRNHRVVEIQTGPLIHKGKPNDSLHAILFDYYLHLDKDNTISIWTELEYQIDKTFIKLPVIIKIWLNDQKLGPNDLMQIISESANTFLNKPKIVIFEQYIKAQFHSLAQLRAYHISYCFEQLANSQHTVRQFMNDVIKHLTFPDHLLSNFEKWGIEIQEPIITTRNWQPHG